jgi:hypothetical protein
MGNETKKIAQATLKSEKTSAILALFGPEFVERLQQRHPEFISRVEDDGTASLARVAWQKNRLLEKLRLDRERSQPIRRFQQKDSQVRENNGSSRKRSEEPSKIDTFIASGLNLSDLRHEHPAVIARVLRGLDRQTRVTILQQLPGKTARAALRRLSSP